MTYYEELPPLTRFTQPLAQVVYWNYKLKSFYSTTIMPEATKINSMVI